MSCITVDAPSFLNYILNGIVHPAIRRSGVSPQELTKVERDLIDADALLSRLITLNAALAGAAIFLLTDSSLGIMFRGALVLLIAATICALKGRLLRATPVANSDADAEAKQIQSMLRTKQRCIDLCAFGLVVALMLAAGGVLTR
jgi:hypothetical protein